MANFIPRLTPPAANDKHYFSNENIFYACGYGMPNCTAYAWGRFYEITGKRITTLCGNAEDFYDSAIKSGLKVGQTPKLGAIIVWRAGHTRVASDGAGHVAVVEERRPNGDIVTSNSAWKSTMFYTTTLTKASGYIYSPERPLLGFIYCGIEFDNAPVINDDKKEETGVYEYVIKKGDTLYKLAAANNTTVDEILRLNPQITNPSNIITGDTIKLPSNGGTKTEEVVTPPSTPTEGTTIEYVIKRGDTLSKIAATYNTTVNAIVSINPKITNPSNIMTGDTIKIPVGTSSSAPKTIKKGDKFVLNNVPVYNSGSGSTIGTRSGTYYVWSDVPENNRYKMTNSAARVGVAGQVSFFVDKKYLV